MNAFPSIETPIERSFDAAFFNRVCNLPGVREWLGHGDKPLDVTDIVQSPLNYALKAKRGGFILLALGGGHYIVHSQFEPGSNEAADAMRAGFAYMFTRTDCVRVVSLIPDGNAPAKGLGRLAGFPAPLRQHVSLDDRRALGRGRGAFGGRFGGARARDQTDGE